ncbi:hypothetical protein G3R49_15920 [Shewanella sp. WXL01]|uniref:Glycosyltransferase family 1 protein n=1 Tax=Shewanella maritima TaxID=2520507 RepID=A0A411PIC7_9GAMM|nr:MULTISPECIES: hypothetical protein [Shewanella]NKF52051.1 hypothetical protein [Shewanella sp. WXL01]QBF83152.1 hypothetical protein EXU30_10935 [Shewanella maritima]
MPNEPKLLFIPVSSDEGIGEYMRSTIIADEAKCQWPNAQIDFVLNRHAPYCHSCHYRTHLLDDTPTKKIKEVNQLITELKPDVVIFDAAGRKSQLKHAKRSGAQVVFISQHKRKRARGMKLERALATDSHWVVQPEFVIGDISAFNRFKLNLIKRPEPICIGSIFPHPDIKLQQQLLQRYQLVAKQYLFFSAGSGGHLLNNNLLAADVWAKVAQQAYMETQVPSVMVFGPNYPKPLPELPGVIAISALDTKEFISLLNGAKAAVLSGGDTLLQSIALKVPTVVAPVSKDQPDRIRKCAQAHMVLAADASYQSLLSTVLGLLKEQSFQELSASLQASPTENGLVAAMDKLQQLVNTQAHI